MTNTAQRGSTCTPPQDRFAHAGFDDGDLFLMEGFIGSAPDGTPTTLGRGGSDLSAAYAACFLDAARTWKNGPMWQE